MDKVCVTSVVHGKDFQYYIPMFVYSTNKAYPEYDVQIFLTEELDPEVFKIVDKIKNNRTRILYNDFGVAKMREYSSNALRHLIPESRLCGYDYWHPTDIDFIMLRQKRPHIEYYKHIMEKTQQIYAGARGPIKGFCRVEISPAGWIGNYQRIAAGCFAAKVPEWFNKTRRVREGYIDIFKRDGNDRYDTHKPGSYREYDEVMLFRIVRDSCMSTPNKKDHFIYGKKMNACYRSIHLGDFKFVKRWKNIKKMKIILTQNNVESFIELEKDPVWRNIVDECCKNKMINDVIRNLRHHIKKRT